MSAPFTRPRRGVEPRKPFHDDPRRAVAALTLGMVRKVDRRNERTRELAIRETVLCFQIPLTGDASAAAITWAEVTVEFDHHFHYSPGTQDSDFDVPTMAWGGVLEGNPVLLSAHVMDWSRDPDNDAVVTGAQVRVGAFSPEADPVSFGGTLHLTFTGWATLFEDETEMSE